MYTRRSFVALGAAAALGACTADTVTRTATPDPVLPPLPAFYGPVTDEPFPVPAIPEGVVPPRLWRREVANPWPARPRGTIVVDPDAAILHFVQGPDTAIRYGVSVGAAGFGWDGIARLQFCRKWPRWKVPATMSERHPHLEPYSVANGGMDPGPDNPMGARALYLFENGRDTLYRIHGGCEPEYLGKAVSSGCIRMLDQDVIDLHARALHGATVIVQPSLKPQGLASVY